MNDEHKIIQQVYAAKEDLQAADRLIGAYMPFIKAETAKFLKRPPMLSTAIIVAAGKIIAESESPRDAWNHLFPDIMPISGGNTIFPAPKNMANIAKPIIKILIIIFLSIKPHLQLQVIKAKNTIILSSGLNSYN